MKYTKFKDIPQFPNIHYSIDVGLDYLPDWIERQTNPGGGMSPLQLCPDFQRGHVWTREQQISFMEYLLQRGTSGKMLYFNHPGWMNHYKGDFVLVDGLQRITAALAFLNNEIPVFGSYRNEFTDKPIFSQNGFKINIAVLKTKKDVLDWYIMMNSGGTPHSLQEIERVKEMRNKL